MGKALKKVVKLSYWSNKYNRPGEGRTEHHLDCGHSILTKNSYGNPRRMRCKTCPDMPISKMETTTEANQ